jgi:hypothetical protein
VASAGAPGFGSERGLRFNPGPTEGGMHLAMSYGGAGTMVPWKSREQGREKAGGQGIRDSGPERTIDPSIQWRRGRNGTAWVNCSY